MRRIAALLALLSLSLGVLASTPYAEIKLKNFKASSKVKNRISKDWSLYLKDKTNLLYLKDATGQKQKYRSDQFCVFNGQLLSSGEIDLNSLKLEKHKQNFEYNLAAVDFLRLQAYKFEKSKRDPNKKVRISFYYYAF